MKYTFKLLVTAMYVPVRHIDDDTIKLNKNTYYHHMTRNPDYKAGLDSTLRCLIQAAAECGYMHSATDEEHTFTYAGTAEKERHRNLGEILIHGSLNFKA